MTCSWFEQGYLGLSHDVYVGVFHCVKSTYRIHYISIDVKSLIVPSIGAELSELSSNPVFQGGPPVTPVSSTAIIQNAPKSPHYRLDK